MSALRTVKAVHTVVWAFFAGCILAIPYFAWRGHRVYGKHVYAVARMTLADSPRQNIAMNNHTHTLVWLDHRVAKVFCFDSNSSDVSVVHSTHPHAHLHHKANARDSGHVSLDRPFLDSIASAIPPHGPVLIVGPGTAKKELHSHLLDRHPNISGRISAVTSLDHPTDGELLACGRRFFDADDRMHARQAP